ncbi:MAG TPA: hypothetical protein VEN29_09300 [Casimicrobiaceae bacterium]|nr:hypothetical protein [Casimicrobiaceae bacterium]
MRDFGWKPSNAIQCLGATLALAVAACASMGGRSAVDYDRGSASEAQFRKDASACEKQAEASGKEFGYGPYDPTFGAYNRMFDMCMRTSGYPRKPQQP